MVVVRVVPAAEALSPFAQVIGGYTRCDSNRDLLRLVVCLYC